MLAHATLLYEAVMSRRQSARPATVNVNQTVVERPLNDRVATIRFYGNCDPGKLLAQAGPPKAASWLSISAGFETILALWEADAKVSLVIPFFVSPDNI